MSAYYQAIKRNDIETLQRICNDDPDVVHVSNDFKYMCKKGNLEMAIWFAQQYTCDTSSSLKSAAMKGHLHVVKWLIPRCHWEKVRISINAACKHGRLDVVRYMYDYITLDTDFFDDSKYLYTKQYLFGLVCSHGHIDIVEYLLKKDIAYSKYVNASFSKSCTDGVLKMVMYLANHTQMDVSDIRNGLLMASCCGHMRIIQWFLDTYSVFDDDDYDAAFGQACETRLDVVKYLVNRQPNIMTRNHREAFYNACVTNHIDILKWLIANVDVAGKAMSSKYQGDITQECFKNACYDGHLEIAQLILHTYPIVQACMTDITFLTDSHLYHHLDIVQWLLQSDIKADIDVQVAFELACHNYRTRVAKFLIETYDINIHTNCDRIFLTACVKSYISIIKIFTVHSDDIASYHLAEIANENHGYMITRTKLTDVPSRIEHIQENDVFIYVCHRASSASILEDAKRNMAIYRKKSARS